MIYNTHTLKPFKDLGLDSQRVKKLASKLHVHSVDFAAKLVHTRRALSSTVINSHLEPVSGQVCNPPDPHWCFLSYSRWRSFTVLGTKEAPFPYLMWGVAFTACVVFLFSFFQPRPNPWLLLLVLYCSAYLVFMSADACLMECFQFVSFLTLLMVIQIRVCQRFVRIIFVDSPHSSNNDIGSGEQLLIHD